MLTAGDHQGFAFLLVLMRSAALLQLMYLLLLPPCGAA
jgi:hypothetical protein